MTSLRVKWFFSSILEKLFKFIGLECNFYSFWYLHMLSTGRASLSSVLLEKSNVSRKNDLKYMYSLRQIGKENKRKINVRKKHHIRKLYKSLLRVGVHCLQSISVDFYFRTTFESLKISRAHLGLFLSVRCQCTQYFIKIYQCVKGKKCTSLNVRNYY